VLAAPAALAPLVRATGAVDRHLETPAYVREPMREVPWPHREPPAVAVNLHGRGPQSHRVLLALQPDRLLAFANPQAGFLDGPMWTADEHEVPRWCRMLSAYDIAADPADLALAPPPAPAAPGAVLVHPGASGPERCWPVDRYAAVAAAVRAAGHPVLVTGSAAEVRLARAVAAAADLPEDAVVAGRTDLAALAGMVAHARLVVCGDTGVAHLATAYGTPSVVLFGPMTPARWGPPPGRSRHVALWRGPAGLAGITVAQVLAAAEQAVGHAAATV